LEKHTPRTRCDQTGACWRIGDGQKVKVWHHAWLPSKPPTRILSPVLEGWEEATIDKLINEDFRTWDEDVINGLFVPEEADLIKSISLSRFPTEDRLFWLNFQGRWKHRWRTENSGTVYGV